MKRIASTGFLFMLMFALMLPVVLGQSTAGTDWWPMFGKDPTHAGYSTSTVPNEIETKWTHELKTYSYYSHPEWYSPVVADGKVYAGISDGSVCCLNASSGEKIWDYGIYYASVSTPAFSDGKVYIGLVYSGGLSLHRTNVICLDATNGNEVWTYESEYGYELGGDVSSPVVVNGRVYIGSHTGRRYLSGSVFCLDSSNGSLIWEYATGGRVHSSPAVAGGRVYVGSEDYGVYCLDASSDQQIWKYTTGDEVRSSPAIADSKVYVGSDDNRVYCLNAANGEQIWTYTTGDDVYSSPAVAYGRVYVGSRDNNTYCLDASNGTLIWKYATEGAVYSSPAVADGKVCVCSYDYHIYCLNASNGNLIWKEIAASSSSPAIADGRVYVGSSVFRCFEAAPPVLPIRNWMVIAIGAIVGAIAVSTAILVGRRKKNKQKKQSGTTVAVQPKQGEGSQTSNEPKTTT
jgi:outer membrane protein assembly factor BamB